MTALLKTAFARIATARSGAVVAALVLVAAGAGATNAYAPYASVARANAQVAVNPFAMRLADIRRLPNVGSEGPHFVALDVALAGLPEVGNR